MKLELVSFKLCPYVQRSVITLNYKEAPYQITYIDLENPPEWFDKISPLGKVPLLKVNDTTVLFESAVINEFIDETVGTPLLPRDPLKRAFERAWIQYGSELLMSLYEMSQINEPSKLPEKQKEFFTDLARLEDVVAPEGPYFGGAAFSLADAAFAPLFMRVFLSERLKNDGAWKGLPKVSNWAGRLLDLPAVKRSVVPEFPTLFRESSRKRGGLLF